MNRVGQIQDHIGQNHDANGVVEGEQLVKCVPVEHKSDDQHDTRQHFREQTHAFQYFLINTPGFAYREHDSCAEDRADAG